MKAKMIILSATLLGSSLLGSQAMAQESGLQRVLSQMVSGAIDTVVTETKQNVAQSIANQTYRFSLDNKGYSGTTSITDLQANVSEMTDSTATSEDDE